MAVKTWFITGTSRGFGREWAIAALDRGDMVAATARDIASLDDLAAKYGDAILPIRLDVTDRGADFAAVKLAHLSAWVAGAEPSELRGAPVLINEILQQIWRGLATLAAEARR